MGYIHDSRIPVLQEDVRSRVRFGRGLNLLVGLELQTLQPPQGEPREEVYEAQVSPSAP